MKKIRNKVVYIKDGKMLEKAKKIIECAGHQLDPDYKRIIKSNEWLGFSERFDMFILSTFVFGRKEISFNRFKWIMRPTWLKIAEFVGYGVIITLLLALFTSCATPKQNQRKAVKHYEKAVKFGLKEKPSVPDSFIYVMVQDTKGNEVLMKRPIFWDCPPSFELPKSNVEIRQDGRNYRAELRNDRKEHNSDNKAETKQSKSKDKAETKQNKSDNKLKKVVHRQEEKTERKWAKWINGFMIGIAIGIIATILVGWWIGAYRRKDEKEVI